MKEAHTSGCKCKCVGQVRHKHRFLQPCSMLFPCLPAHVDRGCPSKQGLQTPGYLKNVMENKGPPPGTISTDVLCLRNDPNLCFGIGFQIGVFRLLW